MFGVKVGEAYATASANYFDVVCFHSVIMFVPLFIGWACMLRLWDFHPTFVFLLFGLLGSVAEIGESHQFLTVGMWVFVYGLMIYLPAYSLPDAKTRKARPPRWWWYPVAILLPALFVPCSRRSTS